jgi:potassium voltage-gated channel Shal-related subfamily D protein 1/potassium voltage-gated channel Shal-related subfamily D protein 3/potassium voltage-gated channel Shal-related subfamily D protein
MTTVVCFNVGGTLYEVSRSLLEMYPDTMLARSASEQWHTDPISKIFLERDGDRFTYVLDYLRDGCTNIPATVPQAALLADLEYFGVQDVDENQINVLGGLILLWRSSKRGVAS